MKKNMICKNKTLNIVVTSRVKRADSFFSRLKGLMFVNFVDSREGLFIPQCSMIHTCFMRFSIDVVFLDADFKVLKLINGMRPWRFSKKVSGCAHVLEMLAGTAFGKIREKDILEFV